MSIRKSIVALVILSAAMSVANAQLLEKRQLETGILLPGYSNIIDAPFTGVAAYANNDGVELQTNLSDVPGKFRLDIRGASNANNNASISVYLDNKKLGTASFSGTSASTERLSFNLTEYPANSNLKFVLETDNGSNDTYLDWYEMHRVGDIPPPPPPPVLPATGAYESGVYRNLFAEMGYNQAEIDAKVTAAYDQLFHSTDTQEKALFIPVGNDMAYIWDVHNNDVRSEGMSYGMMMAVQMDRQSDFNKLWKWAHTYSLNKSGDMKGYFAWKVSTSGNVQDKNPAPDGEEYFATALFFAANKWGNGSGIFNYQAQANNLLDDMYNNGQTRYNNQGQLESFSLFDHDEKQVVFSPATPSDRNWTDPSYHLPAFYELWARWADNNRSFYADLAVSSREFLKTTVNPENGLSPDYAYFDGRPHGEFQHWKDTFQYDAWRTVNNAAMDYAWWKKDAWQNTYAESLQNFLGNEVGVDSYASLYELDGTPYENNTDHSAGLVAMNAVASLASNETIAWEFVQALWDLDVPSGRYRYYDGSLYMLGLLSVSGKYKIIFPAGECDSVEPPTCEELGNCPVGNKAPKANNDSATVNQNQSVSINVLSNDTDADGDNLTISNVGSPSNGTTSNSGSTITYTPNANFSGSDSFNYTITDGIDTATAIVSVTVKSGGGTTDPSTLLETFQLETGVLDPSYRQPITNPFAGIILYGNNESVTASTSKLNAGRYSLVINGASSNGSAAGISIYADGTKVGSTSFIGTTRTQKTVKFTLNQPATQLMFKLETDVGQNDTLLDWYKLYSESTSGGGNPDPDAGNCSAIMLQAEDYVDFYDTTNGNSGNQYKNDAVDIQGTSDIGGGYNVGWTADGEWLEFSTSFGDCNYSVEVRVASQSAGGQYTIDINGTEVVGPENVGNTGGWQNWMTKSHNNVNPANGTATVRFSMPRGNFNVNWISFTPVK